MLLIVGIAKANDYFNKPWIFAGIYVAIMFFQRMLFPYATKTFGASLLNLGFTFVVLGVMFSLLHRYKDSILAWLSILFVGLFVLSAGAKLILGAWLQ